MEFEERFTPQAAQDLEDILEYNSSKKNQQLFLEQMDKGIERIKKHPEYIRRKLQTSDIDPVLFYNLIALYFSYRGRQQGSQQVDHTQPNRFFTLYL